MYYSAGAAAERRRRPSNIHWITPHTIVVAFLLNYVTPTIIQCISAGAAAERRPSNIHWITPHTIVVAFLLNYVTPTIMQCISAGAAAERRPSNIHWITPHTIFVAFIIIHYFLRERIKIKKITLRCKFYLLSLWFYLLQI